MSYIIGRICAAAKDGACIEACPIQDCIMEGENQMYINPELCIDCGACLPVCPVNAIFESEDQAIKVEGNDTSVQANYSFYNLKF